MYRIPRVFALVALLASAAYGCTDQATPFETVSAGLDVRVGGPFLSLSQVEQTVHVLERTAPLAADVEEDFDEDGAEQRVPALLPVYGRPRPATEADRDLVGSPRQLAGQGRDALFAPVQFLRQQGRFRGKHVPVNRFLPQGAAPAPEEVEAAVALLRATPGVASSSATTTSIARPSRGTTSRSRR